MLRDKFNFDNFGYNSLLNKLSSSFNLSEDKSNSTKLKVLYPTPNLFSKTSEVNFPVKYSFAITLSYSSILILLKFFNNLQ